MNENTTPASNSGNGEPPIGTRIVIDPARVDQTGLPYIPHRVACKMVVHGYFVSAAGIDRMFSVAALKARSEAVERVFTSDLMNDDVTGLVTYKQKNMWCSTGAACHPDKEICLLKSTAELIERETTSAWCAVGPPSPVIWQAGNRIIVRPPCRFKGWHVAVCIRSEEGGTKLQLSASAHQNLDKAAEGAYLESFLRDALDDRFKADRLPWLPFGEDNRVGTDDVPSMPIRWWQESELHICKQWNPEFSDFYRGIQPTTLDAYTRFLGGTWTPRQIYKSWFF